MGGLRAVDRRRPSRAGIPVCPRRSRTAGSCALGTGPFRLGVRHPRIRPTRRPMASRFESSPRRHCASLSRQPGRPRRSRSAGERGGRHRRLRLGARRRHASRARESAVRACRRHGRRRGVPLYARPFAANPPAAAPAVLPGTPTDDLVDRIARASARRGQAAAAGRRRRGARPELHAVAAPVFPAATSSPRSSECRGRPAGSRARECARSARRFSMRRAD